MLACEAFIHLKALQLQHHLPPVAEGLVRLVCSIVLDNHRLFMARMVADRACTVAFMSIAP